MSDKYAGKTISRTIQMLGEHTLGDLHLMIFGAFGREDEHLWEFQIGGKRWGDPKNRRYGPSQCLDATTHDGDKTALCTTHLKPAEIFGYLFDFGDDWMHEIQVISIEETTNKIVKPKLIKSVGKAPPQSGDY